MTKNSSFGKVIGAIAILLMVIACALLLLSRLAIRTENPVASSVGSMRTILTAEVSYRESRWKTATGELVGYSATLKDLGGNGGSCVTGGAATSTQTCLIDDVLANAISPATPKSGYYYVYVRTNGGNGFAVNGNPANPKKDSHYFFSDQSGVIRFSRGRPATVNDQPIQ
jgi:hypothetical protein